MLEEDYRRDDRRRPRDARADPQPQEQHERQLVPVTQVSTERGESSVLESGEAASVEEGSHNGLF